MSDLPARIKAFLNRHPSPEVKYVPGSLTEMLMATYATEGSLDEEDKEWLDICEIELVDVVAFKSGPAADYFSECLTIVRDIQGELRREATTE